MTSWITEVDTTMEINEDYEKHVICGVDTIVWKWLKSDAMKSEIKKRKQLKDEVSETCQDTPMMDMRMSKNKLEFCDIVMRLSDLGAWQNAIHQFYGSESVQMRSMLNGNKLIINRDETHFVTITLYTGTNRLMIQPADNQEKKLLAVLKDIPAIRAIITQTDSEDKDHSAGENVEIPSLTNSMDEDFETYSDQISSPESNAKVVLIEEGDNEHSEPAAENMKVILPPRPPDTREARNELKPEVQEPLITVTRPVYVNELLCFIQNRMQSLPVDNVIKLCMDFYTPEDITASKQMLFEHTENYRPERSRLIKRTGVNKNRDNLHDMVKVFLSIELSDIPSYAAVDLSKLPPLSAFDNDVIGLHREVESLKVNFNMVVNSQKDMTAMIKRLSEPHHKSDAKYKTQTDVSIQSDDMETTSDIDRQANQMRESTMIQHTVSPPEVHGSSYETGDNSNSCSNSSDDTDNDEDLDEAPTQTEGWMTYAGVAQRLSERMSKPIRTCYGNNGEKSRHTRPTQKFYKEYHRTTDKQYGKQPIIGTGTFAGLKTVNQRSGNNSQGPNRSITGVFISRLHAKTSATKIASHVRHETNLSVNPEKLQTRYDHYSSFYIRCDNRERRTLMDIHMWPTGTLIKPYFS